MVLSTQFDWQRRAGVFLAVGYLRNHPIPVDPVRRSELPQFSRRAIAFALRIFPDFLDRADLTFPVIIAGRGWYQVALDGRHRISKATWLGLDSLPAVRVPWRYALELLFPGVYEVEWVVLFVRRELRRAARWRPT